MKNSLKITLAAALFGIAAAALTFAAPTARASIAPVCPGGSQLCSTGTTCVGVPPLTYCETSYYYQKG